MHFKTDTWINIVYKNVYGNQVDTCVIDRSDCYGTNEIIIFYHNLLSLEGMNYSKRLIFSTYICM